MVILLDYKHSNGKMKAADDKPHEDISLSFQSTHHLVLSHYDLKYLEHQLKSSQLGHSLPYHFQKFRISLGSVANAYIA